MNRSSSICCLQLFAEVFPLSLLQLSCRSSNLSDLFYVISDPKHVRPIKNNTLYLYSLQKHTVVVSLHALIMCMDVTVILGL